MVEIDCDLPPNDTLDQVAIRTEKAMRKDLEILAKNFGVDWSKFIEEVNGK